MTVPITDGEAILRRENHEISILVATDDVTITHAWCSAGEQVAGTFIASTPMRSTSSKAT